MDITFSPDDDGYDAERSGFQTGARHRPDLIVGATGPDDVQAAVRHAGERGLPVAVQAAGHAVPAHREGGVLVTTGRMAGVHVDAGARTVRVEAGTRWQQVIDAAAPAGLAPLSGTSPIVGAVAYTLGGGLGLLSRSYGYAADHVSSIDVVTADGRARHLTAESDPDLFWALRGGRDNFGVVTALEVDLVPVTRLYGGGLFYPMEHAADVLRAYREWTATVPEEMTSSVALIPFGPGIVHVRIAYTGDTATGERLVAPLRDVAPLMDDTLGDLPYTESGSIFNEPAEPHSYDADNAMLRGIDDSTVGLVLDVAGPDAPIPCIVQLRHLGGALGRPPAVPNAVGHRDAEHLLSVLSPMDGVDAGVVHTVHSRLIDAVQPWTVGRNLNYLYGTNVTAEQVRSAYDPADYERLTALKREYDPANMFRLNHNIPPA